MPVTHDFGVWHIFALTPVLLYNIHKKHLTHDESSHVDHPHEKIRRESDVLD